MEATGNATEVSAGQWTRLHYAVVTGVIRLLKLLDENSASSERGEKHLHLREIYDKSIENTTDLDPEKRTQLRNLVHRILLDAIFGLEASESNAFQAQVKGGDYSQVWDMVNASLDVHGFARVVPTDVDQRDLAID